MESALADRIMKGRKVSNPIFRHEWEHPDLPRWQARLEEVFGKYDRLNWLKIVWEPGMPYMPVQRWVIYEMVPLLQYVPPLVMYDLTGENPRTNGSDILKRDDKGHVYNVWVSDSFVTRNQWRLFRETGCYAKKFWIIQGSNGGHMYTLSAAEKSFLADRGMKDAETPLQGDLPYAEFDERTVGRLLMLDKLQNWDQNISWDQRQERATKAGLWVRRDRVREEMAFNVKLLDFLESQIDKGTDQLSRRTINRMVSELPRTSDRDTAGKMEAADEEFIRDTNV